MTPLAQRIDALMADGRPRTFNDIWNKMRNQSPDDIQAAIRVLLAQGRKDKADSARIKADKNSGGIMIYQAVKRRVRA